MRVRADGSWDLRPGGAAQFALLMAAAWVAGLAIVVLFAIAQPARPAAHAGVSATPSGDMIRDTAGRRWAIGVDVQVTAGRRWTLSPADSETAGRRWTLPLAGGVAAADLRG